MPQERILNQNGGDSAVFLLTEEYVQGLLPERPRDSHKGKNGRALLFAGSDRYAGAALISAAAALRTGAGILYVCVPRGIRPAFFSLPEAICLGVGEGGNWDARAIQDALLELSGKDALALGPGMDRMETDALLRAVLEEKKPLVLDADGLNALSRNPNLYQLLHPGVVITPHPGEMARLTGNTAAEIGRDPVHTAESFAKKYGCTVLLKGHESIITDGEQTCRNTTGNPGLAKGGSGDVLTGMILALLAQGLSPFAGAAAGAFLLGCSADRAFALLGTRMLMARDVLESIPLAVDGEK